MINVVGEISDVESKGPGQQPRGVQISGPPPILSEGKQRWPRAPSVSPLRFTVACRPPRKGGCGSCTALATLGGRRLISAGSLPNLPSLAYRGTNLRNGLWARVLYALRNTHCRQHNRRRPYSPVGLLACSPGNSAANYRFDDPSALHAVLVPASLASRPGSCPAA